MLLDGMVSHLGQVITTHAPSAVWQVGYHRIKCYQFQNHPVLTSPTSGSQIFLPGPITVGAGRLRHGLDPVVEDRFSAHACAVIDELQREHPPEPVEPEPLLEVEADDDVFDVGLREDLTHEHPRLMDRTVKALAKQPGVDSVFREDREGILVRAPDWSAGDLAQWSTAWIRRHVPAAH